MRGLLFIFLLFCITNFRCKKNRLANCNSSGIIHDASQVMGCKFVIVLDNGKSLEPVQLAQGIVLEKDRRASICYERVDGGTPCMMGELVKVTKLQYLP
jgi:hypothetical protein